MPLISPLMPVPQMPVSHGLSLHFNGHFPGEPGLAPWTIDYGVLTFRTFFSLLQKHTAMYQIFQLKQYCTNSYHHHHQLLNSAYC